jgi:hypothetical protein
LCLELISKRFGQDEDHRELEEGLVGVGFAVAAGGDAAAGFQPGVGAFDGPAVAGLRVAGLGRAFAAAPDGRRLLWRRLAAAAPLADPRLDPAREQLLLEFG